MSGVVADKTGQRFGRLLVVRVMPRPTWRSLNAEWLCQCDCGVRKVISGANLAQTRSCGCLHVKHGHYANGKPSPEYTVWSMMKQRCLNPNATDYKYYGARGITVCRRWQKSFKSFCDDMGTRPQGLTLDRIDPNGNYEPSNCRWATAKEQRANQRRSA